MGILVGLVVAYGAGMALVALRLGWHVAFRLDAYDWRYGHVWRSFIFSCVLWPFLLARPRELWQAGSLLDGSDGQSARLRALDRLRANPPPCGSHVRYRPEQGNDSDAVGNFVFAASLLQSQLETSLREHPHLAKGQHGAIHHWLRLRNDAIAEPTDVPRLWSEFDEVADEALAQGNGHATCAQCGAQSTADAMMRNVDSAAGWVFHRWMCANGHPLLVVNVMHFTFVPSKQAQDYSAT